MLVDKDSKYMLNAFPYLGKDETRTNTVRLADHVVEKLSQPYLNKGRNITLDNFFTSKIIAEKMNSKRTTIVGTLNKIRREVPKEVKIAKDPLYSTTILQEGNMTMTVYQAKPNKNVVVLSTMHQDVQISYTGKKKPETILCYNETKYGVDVVDQMARKYSVKASSRRWPVHTFYNILDLCGINAWILYKEATGNKIKRKSFLLNLGKELASKNKTRRASERIPIAAVPIPSTSRQSENRKRRRCQIKENCKDDGKSQNICMTCQKCVCKQCVKKTHYECVQCGEDTE